MNRHLWTIIAIFIGGIAGTLLRYLINLQTMTLLFPLGTVIENLVGSLLLGILTGWVMVKMIPPLLKEGLGVGFCGGFTTMSTLAADSVLLAGELSMLYSGLYLLISLVGGVTLALFGMIMGQKIAKGKLKEGEGV
ncbi:chromosome condensation protein CrcB [Salipaludibacillus keqinensis]|uniref:Fluoride-specific ion channel FluC n=1 Tax=Salipaludibacillus keqinensis TaxID=2045207 RepID=A0A323TE08_9BACI|nr:CrcB family protein [Salipaludibacillus keqinensis]PYZ92077.1 chromosome condensation protein CrcB [Salipaludibacillus keqinensis]